MECIRLEKEHLREQSERLASVLHAPDWVVLGTAAVFEKAAGLAWVQVDEGKYLAVQDSSLLLAATRLNDHREVEGCDCAQIGLSHLVWIEWSLNGRWLSDRIHSPIPDLSSAVGTATLHFDKDFGLGRDVALELSPREHDHEPKVALLSALQREIALKGR